MPVFTTYDCDGMTGFERKTIIAAPMCGGTVWNKIDMPGAMFMTVDVPVNDGYVNRGACLSFIKLFIRG